MKYFKFLFSGAFMGILLITLGIAIAKATFIENDFDASTARMLIYNTWWFEGILVLMVVNFTGMIFTKRLYVKSKLNILVIHLALILVIIGAGVTRYIGYEGQMHIRNGQESDLFSSADNYLYSKIKKGDQELEISKKVTLSPVKTNLLSTQTEIDGIPFKISVIRYLPNTVERLVQVENGFPYLTMVLGTSQGRKEYFLKEGEIKELPGITVSFGDSSNTSYVSIIRGDSGLYIRSPQAITSVHMQNEPQETIEPDIFKPIELMTVQRIGNLSFVLTGLVESADLRREPVMDESADGEDMVVVSINGQQKNLRKNVSEKFSIDGVEGSVYVGNMTYKLPFSLQLNRFDLERYPGSSSPSSFASDVLVIDEERGNRFEYRIFMNNVLDYRGYRFFQSSYDQDEKGTILSVNHDYWGTMITYWGYALLFGSLIVSLFTRTRVHTITQQINEIHAQRKKIVTSVITGLILISGTINGQNYEPDGRTIDKKHAAMFGRLMVQSKEGRLEPANTVANKILVKIHKSTNYEGMNAEQAFLGMVSDPAKWQSVPLIKVGDAELRSILSITSDYASFNDFLDGGSYKLREYVDRAYQKKPALRSTLDKEVINVDERVNILYQVLNGAYLNIFPVPDHPENKWLSPGDVHQMSVHGSKEGDMFEAYLAALRNATNSGSYAEAETTLNEIKDYQNENGKDVMPSETSVNLEIFYNEVNIFKRLFPFYLIIGILLVGIFFLQTFSPTLNLRLLRNILTGVLAIAFLLQTFGLGLRWYISGHAPWSNGYESMIYISWATLLAGFIFMKRSPVSLAVTAVIAGITLLTAHMSWLNPEITNLVPVLKSYWLTIHVATITASYGFLALGCMMGFLNLILMVFRNQSNQLRVSLMLKELTLIIELSLSVGLVLLVIGNFLGGIWANESWGRYWGWDPKESWTLVTIIFYSFVLHMRLIPGIRNLFTFNLFALIGFGCVLMTYFGVNYYLSGLHSYANGDPVPVPSFVYYTLLVIFIVSIAAAFNEQKWKGTDLEPSVETQSKAQ